MTAQFLGRRSHLRASNKALDMAHGTDSKSQTENEGITMAMAVALKDSRKTIRKTRMIEIGMAL
ncbi:MULTISPECIES: hypothetical protein [unclassified Ruegeria]|uniref:hypothetical protein n=1 Tax=unclassified Ruegeria TaxID=2625375 RepID=UPI0020C536CA|nr:MULTISPECIES: hypothetical protein [unclassified Ruegeria]